MSLHHCWQDKFSHIYYTWWMQWFVVLVSLVIPEECAPSSLSCPFIPWSNSLLQRLLAPGGFVTWAVVLGEIMWEGLALNLTSTRVLLSSGSPMWLVDRWHSVQSRLHLCSGFIYCSQSDKWLRPGVAHTATYTVNHSSEPQHNSSLGRTAEEQQNPGWHLFHLQCQRNCKSSTAFAP